MANVERFLSENADPNVVNSSGDCSLFVVSNHIRLFDTTAYNSTLDNLGKVFEMLLDKGANANVKFFENEHNLGTFLFSSISENTPRLRKVFDKLLEHGFDLKDELNTKLLDHVHDIEVAETLYKADLKFHSDMALKVAIGCGKLDFANWAIEHGVKINPEECSDSTPLHLIIYGLSNLQKKAELSISDLETSVKYIKLFDTLLKYGADLHARASAEIFLIDGKPSTVFDYLEASDMNVVTKESLKEYYKDEWPSVQQKVGIDANKNPDEVHADGDDGYFSDSDVIA